MNKEEAIEWLTGKRSLCNSIQEEPRETWTIRIAQADAAMMEQAYWFLKARKENLFGIEYEWGTEDFMPKVGGQSFRCECGCNVFKRSKDELHYKCNACQLVYRGEK